CILAGSDPARDQLLKVVSYLLDEFSVVDMARQPCQTGAMEDGSSDSKPLAMLAPCGQIKASNDFLHWCSEAQQHHSLAEGIVIVYERIQLLPALRIAKCANLPPFWLDAELVKAGNCPKNLSVVINLLIGRGDDLQ